jgi:hypothetical protein
MPNMKAAVIATGLALLTLATPAYASWAENANSRYPVFTGTNASLARAQARAHSGRYYHRHSVRRVRHHPVYYR